MDATLLDAAAAGASATALRTAGGGRPVLLLGHDAAGMAADHSFPRVGKPVRLGELVTRLNAVLSSFEASPEASIALGQYDFHPTSRLVLTPSGARIRLTEKEAAILLYLHRAGGRPVPRAELLGEVWGYSSAVATHTLETHIYRLRRKIEQAPEVARLLVTEEGGYRLEEPG
jgi:DNA-binding response OmpR family regulator